MYNLRLLVERQDEYQQMLSKAETLDEVREVHELIETMYMNLSTEFLEWSTLGNMWMGLYNEACRTLNEMEGTHHA